MNLPRLRREPPLRPEPILDMNQMADRMGVPPLDEGPEAYAPPKAQKDKLMEMAVRTVETFGALPTAKLDEIIKAAEAEITSLKAEAQQIRDDYVRRTELLTADIKRMMDGCVLARKTLDSLRTQVQALDLPAEPVVPAVTPA